LFSILVISPGRKDSGKNVTENALLLMTLLSRYGKCGTWKITGVGEFALTSRAQGLKWCVCDRYVRNGASGTECWFLVLVPNSHPFPTCRNTLSYPRNKAKIQTGGSGNGSEVKAKNKSWERQRI